MDGAGAADPMRAMTARSAPDTVLVVDWSVTMPALVTWPATIRAPSVPRSLADHGAEGVVVVVVAGVLECYRVSITGRGELLIEAIDEIGV